MDERTYEISDAERRAQQARRDAAGRRYQRLVGIGDGSVSEIRQLGLIVGCSRVKGALAPIVKYVVKRGYDAGVFAFAPQPPLRVTAEEKSPKKATLTIEVLPAGRSD